MANMKKLKVCLSSELPDILQRDKNVIYLAYDKLNLYNGQNLIDENFVIGESMPTDPVPGMIYILSTDGSVYRNIDYSNIKIAEIEDTSQIAILKKAGSVFYVNSNNRYYDSQRRTLTLPFTDGDYELNVSLKNEQVFNKNTLIKFNEETNRFEIYGEDGEEFIDFSKPFRGSVTDSVKIDVDGPRITANVRVSDALDNLVRVSSDGLYAKLDNAVDIDVFNEWRDTVKEYKQYAQSVLDSINAEIEHLTQIVSPEKIQEDILSYLSTKYADIELMLNNYEAIKNSLDSIQDIVIEYASASVIDAENRINKTVEENSSWEDLDDAHEYYTNEINYYNKAEEYLNPELTSSEINVILMAAAMEYLDN